MPLTATSTSPMPRRWIRTSPRNSPTTASAGGDFQVIPGVRFELRAREGRPTSETAGCCAQRRRNGLETLRTARRVRAMASMFGSRKRQAVGAIVAIGAALSMAIGTAFAGDDVSAHQILNALAPKKPLTRGLSTAPPAEPVVNASEGKFVT